MKRFSSIFAPGLVLFFAVLMGGWFLQKGVSQDKNVYFQLRLFDELVDRMLDQGRPVPVKDLEKASKDFGEMNGELDKFTFGNSSINQLFYYILNNRFIHDW